MRAQRESADAEQARERRAADRGDVESGLAAHPVFAPQSIHLPTLANIHVVPETFDPKWVGTIEGELQNTDPLLTLQNAQLYAVIFDSAGNIVGGGTGFAFQPLPPGARLFLQMTGFDVIPIENAASAMISISPTWLQPGA